MMRPSSDGASGGNTLDSPPPRDPDPRPRPTNPPCPYPRPRPTPPLPLPHRPYPSRRIITCNWLHAGLFHLLLNMSAVSNMGVSLERRFGFWRVGTLYVLSGLFGAMVSVVFLPGVLSVGASASVFGLVGAVWADVILNYCARCTLQGSGFCCLLLLTVLNLCFGLTPFVDNFMHVGGFVAGLIIGLTSFSEKVYDPRTGRHRRTCVQRELVFFGALAFIVCMFGAIAAALSVDVQQAFRACDICESINCVEISLFSETPWWSCCISRVPGVCMLDDQNATSVTAICNMTGMEPFESDCPRSEPFCTFDPEDSQSVSSLCARLCSQC